MTGPIPSQPSHHVELDDATAWLAEHGLDIADVVEATIRIDRPPGAERIGAWLDASWYKRDAKGRRYVAHDGDSAATGQSTIPLASFPRLTATTPPPDQP